MIKGKLEDLQGAAEEALDAAAEAGTEFLEDLGITPVTIAETQQNLGELWFQLTHPGAYHDGNSGTGPTGNNSISLLGLILNPLHVAATATFGQGYNTTGNDQMPYLTNPDDPNSFTWDYAI